MKSTDAVGPAARMSFPTRRASTLLLAAALAGGGLAAAPSPADRPPAKPNVPAKPNAPVKPDAPAKPAALPDAPATRPDPAAVKPTTYRDLHRDQLAFLRGALIDAYKAGGKRDPKWDAAAVVHLEAAAANFAAAAVPVMYQPADAPARPRVLDLGRAAVAAGCDDPRVLLCHGVGLNDDGQKEEAAKLLRRAVTAFGGPEALGGAKAAAAAGRDPKAARPFVDDYLFMTAAVRLESQVRVPAENRALNAAMDARSVAMACGKLTDFQRRAAFEIVWSDQMPAVAQQRFVAALSARKDADPWLLALVTGRNESNLAWTARGGGWANEVKPEGWAGFGQHLEKARAALTAAWQMAPQLPEPAIHMISVSMGGGAAPGEDARTWFDRARAAQVDHKLAYEAMFRGPLLPRWGGSHDAMLNLGAEGLDDPRYDTVIPWQYVEAARRIGEDTGKPWSMMVDHAEVYDTIAEVCEGYAKALGPGRGDLYKTARAAAACRVEKWKDARRALDELAAAGRKPDLGAFDYFMAGVDPAMLISNAYAFTGPHAVELEACLSRVAGENGRPLLDDLKSMSAGFKALLAKFPPNDPGRLAVAEYAERSELNVKFESGEWTPVPPMRGWATYEGGWRTDKDGATVGRYVVRRSGDPGRTTFLVHWPQSLGRRLGPRFEFAGNLSSDDGGSGMALGGPVVFAREARIRGFVVIDFANKHAGFMFGATQKLAKCDPKPGSEFRLLVDGTRLTLFVDGKQVGDPFDLPDNFVGNTIDVGVGGHGVPGNAEYRFTNLRLRKLGAKE